MVKYYIPSDHVLVPRLVRVDNCIVLMHVYLKPKQQTLSVYMSNLLKEFVEWGFLIMNYWSIFFTLNNYGKFISINSQPAIMVIDSRMNTITNYDNVFSIFEHI